MLDTNVKHQRLVALRPLSPELVASLETAWAVRMVYESSAIDGNSLSLREVSETLNNFSNAKASGKSIKDYEDAIDLGEAWRITKLEAKFEKQLTEPRLLKVYKAFRNCKSNTTYGACLRSNALSIHRSFGGQDSDFEEPEYLGDIFQGLEDIECPIKQAATLHERVRKHPRFDEHPGRAARLAMNFILLAAGYPPISIPTDLRQSYYAALEAADTGDFPTWQNFLSTQLHQELDEWLAALDPASSLKTEH